MFVVYPLLTIRIHGNTLPVTKGKLFDGATGGQNDPRKIQQRQGEQEFEYDWQSRAPQQTKRQAMHQHGKPYAMPRVIQIDTGV